MSKRVFPGILTAALFIGFFVNAAQGQITGQSQDPFILVLGIGQDAGVPQAGNHTHPGWTDPEAAHFATSLGLVDPASGKKWMFEASPDFRRQWYTLERTEPISNALAPDGIFLTHAHIGHYTGLMFLGHESVGASAVSVFAMNQLADFLEMNGPWQQLIAYENIRLRRIAPNVPVRLSDSIRVVPFLVPHRQEYSEVAGYRIEGPNRTILFIPDIDSWENWDLEGHRIEAIIQSVDIAFIDGSFFANGEIPGRDMSGFPHPFISHTMERLQSLPDNQRAKVRFIHLNHTNPVLNINSPEAKAVIEAGYGLARPMERYGL